MIATDETDAAVADLFGATVQKAIAVRDPDDAAGLFSRVVAFLDAAMITRVDDPGILGHPCLPLPAQGIPGIKRATTIVSQVMRHRPQDGHCIVIRQQRLEGMAGHIDEVEAISEAKALPIALDPAHLVGCWPPTSDSQHAVGWIDTDDVEPSAATRQASMPVPQPRSRTCPPIARAISR